MPSDIAKHVEQLCESQSWSVTADSLYGFGFDLGRRIPRFRDCPSPIHCHRTHVLFLQFQFLFWIPFSTLGLVSRIRFDYSDSNLIVLAQWSGGPVNMFAID